LSGKAVSGTTAPTLEVVVETAMKIEVSAKNDVVVP